VAALPVLLAIGTAGLHGHAATGGGSVARRHHHGPATGRRGDGAADPVTSRRIDRRTPHWP
jgi:hypothetical protein